MGYYITPALLGSPKEQMASYFVAFYTNQTINWGMAAALSAILFSRHAAAVHGLFTPGRSARNSAPRAR